jgi:hypothetical protein
MVLNRPTVHAQHWPDQAGHRESRAEGERELPQTRGAPSGDQPGQSDPEAEPLPATIPPSPSATIPPAQIAPLEPAPAPEPQPKPAAGSLTSDFTFGAVAADRSLIDAGHPVPQRHGSRAVAVHFTDRRSSRTRPYIPGRCDPRLRSSHESHDHHRMRHSRSGRPAGRRALLRDCFRLLRHGSRCGASGTPAGLGCADERLSRLHAVPRRVSAGHGRLVRPGCARRRGHLAEAAG